MLGIANKMGFIYPTFLSLNSVTFLNLSKASLLPQPTGWGNIVRLRYESTIASKISLILMFCVFYTPGLVGTNRSIGIVTHPLSTDK